MAFLACITAGGGVPLFVRSKGNIPQVINHVLLTCIRGSILALKYPCYDPETRVIWLCRIMLFVLCFIVGWVCVCIDECTIR